MTWQAVSTGKWVNALTSFVLALQTPADVSLSQAPESRGFWVENQRSTSLDLEESEEWRNKMPISAQPGIMVTLQGNLFIFICNSSE